MPEMHVGVFRTREAAARPGEALHKFVFYVGPKAALERKRVNPDEELVVIKAIPPRFKRELVAKAVAQPRSDVLPSAIGEIEYTLRREGEQRVAIPHHYFPKNFLFEKHEAKGLGYYFSLIAESLLVRQGVTHLNSGKLFSLSPERQRQLTNAGLPLETSVPIRDWMRATGRSLRLYAKRGK